MLFAFVGLPIKESAHGFKRLNSCNIARNFEDIPRDGFYLIPNKRAEF